MVGGLLNVVAEPVNCRLEVLINASIGHEKSEPRGKYTFPAIITITLDCKRSMATM